MIGTKIVFTKSESPFHETRGDEMISPKYLRLKKGYAEG